MRRHLLPRPNWTAASLMAAATLALLVASAPASATVTHSIGAGTQVVRVDSDADDLIRVSCVNGLVNVSGDDPFIGCGEVRGFFVQGGPGNNTIDLSGVDVADFPDLSDVEVRGGDGEDLVTGTVLPDELHGDAKADVLTGGGGADLIRGGDDNDGLVWNEGDGDDVLDGDQGNDSVSVRGTSAAADAISITPQGERIGLERNGPAPIGLDIGTIETISAAGGAGDDNLTTAADLGARVVLSGDEGNDVLTATDTNEDTLRGGDGDDRLVGRGGQDFVSGGEGNDLVIWNDGDGPDDVEGGAGVDTTEVRGAPDRDDEFVVEPSACATPPNCPIEFVALGLDISGGETLTVLGGGGDDTISGSKLMPPGMKFVFRGQLGNDTLQGTDRSDLLAGGRGGDMIGAVDAVRDDVECGRGTDRAALDANDRASRCETIEGGDERVRVAAKLARVRGGVAALKLRCVKAKRCRGTVRLRLRGKTIGKARFHATRNSAETALVRLNRRGARLLTNPRQVKVGVRIDSIDHNGNGWRSRVRVRLARSAR